MAKYLIILLVVSIGLIFARQALAAEAKEEFDKVIPAVGIESLSLSNENGQVEIYASDGDKIIIHAVKKVTGIFEGECKTLLQNIEIKVKQTSNEVEIKHSELNKLMYSQEIQYTISLPAKISIDISTTNGAITCKDRLADVNLETTNGEVEVTNCSGKLHAETTNGEITAECTTGNANFESTNGSLHLKIKLADNGKIGAETTNGSIRLQIPKEVSAAFSAETTNGEITANDFEEFLSFNKHHTHATGKFGSGSGTIKLETTNGGISIESR